MNWRRNTNRKPTIEEIAERVDMTIGEVTNVLKNGQEPMALETPVGEDGDNELGDLLPDQDALAPPDETAQQLLSNDTSGIFDQLDARDREVLQLRYQMYTLEEIASRMDLIRERIRQTERTALHHQRLHPSIAPARHHLTTSPK